jgi:RNA polymerase sigma factor (TIGR02999 family)
MPVKETKSPRKSSLAVGENPADDGLCAASSGPEFDGSKDLDPEVYSELRKLAARRMAPWLNGATLQPTLLVHEAWLRMSANNGKWRDRKHFLATAAITMRHILIDNARRKASFRHGKGLARTETGGLTSLAAPAPDEDILLIDDGLRELEKLHPLWAKVVVARFFGGLSNSEIAESLDISERSVERYWAVAKLWLYKWVQAVKRKWTSGIL